MVEVAYGADNSGPGQVACAHLNDAYRPAGACGAQPALPAPEGEEAVIRSLTAAV